MSARYPRRLEVRITDQHHQVLARLAQSEGNDIASVLRRMISMHGDAHGGEGPPQRESARGATPPPAGG